MSNQRKHNFEKRLLRLSLVFSLCLIFSSCKPLVFRIMGIKKFKSIDNDEIISIPNKYFQDIDFFGSLDTRFYTSANYFYKKTNSELRYLVQPLNYLIFDSNDTLQSSIANCDAGPSSSFFKFTWVDDLDSFPHFNNYFVNNQLVFDTLMSWIDTTSINSAKDPSNADYKCVIFWTKAMHRQNNIFLNEVK